MSRRERFLNLRSHAPLILPSLLLCDFGNLAGEIRRVEATPIECLHLDVMDGHFVPNLTYGMPIVRAAREASDLPLDVHLMIDEPQRFVEEFYDAGADCLTIHVEAVTDPAAVLSQIRQLGAASGIALNPRTPIAALRPCVDLCDVVLVMSVEAGYGGQTFDPGTLQRLREARALAGNDVLLEVDGGINSQTIGDCCRGGAQLCVVGSAIFRQADYAVAVDALRRAAGNASSA